MKEWKVGFVEGSSAVREDSKFGQPGVREVFTEEGAKLRQPYRFLPWQREDLVGFGSRKMATAMGKDWSDVEQ